MPAMSTNSAVALTTFFDSLIAASASSRSSGTFATPTFVSVVENGCAATSALPPVNALKRDDLPALGRPTMPKRSMTRIRVGAAHRTIRP